MSDVMNCGGESSERILHTVKTELEGNGEGPDIVDVHSCSPQPLCTSLTRREYDESVDITNSLDFLTDGFDGGEVHDMEALNDLGMALLMDVKEEPQEGVSNGGKLSEIDTMIDREGENAVPQSRRKVKVILSPFYAFLMFSPRPSNLLLWFGRIEEEKKRRSCLVAHVSCCQLTRAAASNFGKKGGWLVGLLLGWLVGCFFEGSIYRHLLFFLFQVDWTPELHRKFVAAVEQLGVEKAIPSRILEMMGVHCLTRHNIASHLQVPTSPSHPIPHHPTLPTAIHTSPHFQFTLNIERQFERFFGPIPSLNRSAHQQWPIPHFVLVQKYRSHRRHLLAREAEAATWHHRRPMDAALSKMRRDGTCWVPQHVPPHIQPRPSLGLPPLQPHPPPPHPSACPPPPPSGPAVGMPLHVWGHPSHPSLDRPPAHMWQQHPPPPPGWYGPDGTLWPYPLVSPPSPPIRLASLPPDGMMSMFS